MRLFAFILTILFAFLFENAPAQEALQQRINELQYQIDNIVIALKGKKNGIASVPLPDTSGKDESGNLIITQIQSLKNLISDLTNRIEQVEYKLQSFDNSKALSDEPSNSLESIVPEIEEKYVILPGGEESSLDLQKTNLKQSQQTTEEIKLSMKKLYDHSLASLKNEDYDAAKKGFTFFMKKFSDKPLASNALYWLAEIFYTQKDFSEAAKLFLQNFNNYPNGAKIAASLFKLGKTFQILGKKAAACTAYRKVTEYKSKKDENVRKLAVAQLQSLKC